MRTTRKSSIPIRVQQILEALKTAGFSIPLIHPASSESIQISELENAIFDAIKQIYSDDKFVPAKTNPNSSSDIRLDFLEDLLQRII